MMLAAFGLLASFSADGKPGRKADPAFQGNQEVQTDPTSTSGRSASSAQIHVVGNVADDKGEPLPGATIILKGNTEVHAITDIDGNY